MYFEKEGSRDTSLLAALGPPPEAASLGAAFCRDKLRPSLNHLFDSMHACGTLVGSGSKGAQIEQPYFSWQGSSCETHCSEQAVAVHSTSEDSQAGFRKLSWHQFECGCIWDHNAVLPSTWPKDSLLISPSAEELCDSGGERMRTRSVFHFLCFLLWRQPC